MTWRSFALFVLIPAFTSTGCSTMQRHEGELDVPAQEMSAWLSDKPEEAQDLYAMVPIQGDRNRVLNQLRSGLAAFELEAWEAAEASFDDALARIETIYADNPEAERARSRFFKENVKDFKGEPYERAMAYYYRGLLYLREGDFENARASFRGGMLQDTLAEEEVHSQDFAVLAYLEGWASRCLGADERAERSFAEAEGYRPGLVRPGAGDRVLVIYESGHAPIKAALGEHGEKLAVAEDPRNEGAGLLHASNGSRSETMRLAEDLFWQATTRGGRSADDILVAKADFKEGMETAGQVLASTSVSAVTAGTYFDNPNMASAGVAMAAAGLVANVVSAATRPEADDRYWDNLPGRLWVAALPAAPKRSYRLERGDGEEIATSSFGPDACQLVWAREQSALDVPQRAPNSSAKAQATNEN